MPAGAVTLAAAIPFNSVADKGPPPAAEPPARRRRRLSSVSGRTPAQGLLVAPRRSFAAETKLPLARSATTAISPCLWNGARCPWDSYFEIVPDIVFGSCAAEIGAFHRNDGLGVGFRPKWLGPVFGVINLRVHPHLATPPTVAGSPRLRPICRRPRRLSAVTRSL